MTFSIADKPIFIINIKPICDLIFLIYSHDQNSLLHTYLLFIDIVSYYITWYYISSFTVSKKKYNKSYCEFITEGKYCFLQEIFTTIVHFSKNINPNIGLKKT